MSKYINCLIIENTELTNNLKYWESFPAGDNTGKLMRSRMIKKITERLNTVAKSTNNYFLDESSLSRIYRHVEQNPNGTWGTISAQRAALSPKENAQRTETLKRELRSRGYGFIPLEGHWRECQDSTIPYDQCPDDKLVDAVETSFFVPNISRDELTDLGNQFEQDGVLYGGPDTKNQAALLAKDGTLIDVIGRFKPNTVAQAFSRLKNGKPYVFSDEPRPSRTSVPTPPTPDRGARRSELRQKLSHKIKNPETGNDILVSSALKYDPTHPARKAAMEYLKRKA